MDLGEQGSRVFLFEEGLSIFDKPAVTSKGTLNTSHSEAECDIQPGSPEKVIQSNSASQAIAANKGPTNLERRGDVSPYLLNGGRIDG
jgi:hypothetical protein